jgi:hypothetical protein
MQRFEVVAPSMIETKHHVQRPLLAAMPQAAAEAMLAMASRRDS